MEPASNPTQTYYDTFPFFKALPIELQVKIWDHALHEMRPRIGFAKSSDAHYYHALFHDKTPPKYQRLGGYQEFALLHVDRIARDSTLRYIRRQRSWKPFGMELASALCSPEILVSQPGVCFAKRMFHSKVKKSEKLGAGFVMIIEDFGSPASQKTAEERTAEEGAPRAVMKNPERKES